MDDQRFSHIATDPKFRRIPKGERKVKIDKRFKSMFKDERFKVKYTIDKRGRPVNHTSKEDLKRYYELGSGESSSETDDESDVQEETSNQLKAINKSEPNLEESDSELDAESDLKEKTSNQLKATHKSDKSLSNKVKEKLHNLNIDYARGESKLYSESSSDDEEEESDDDGDDEGLEHAWGELDKDAERTEEITHRLAACNMDWDRIKAVDLMVLLNSFLPPGGLIKSVTIYPSEFGLQRMKEEEVKGPSELVDSTAINGDENDDTEGSRYHMEKLRQYQLNRLKYYYAVIVCDNENTANKIYSECDGLEYESSATKMDLRFIPNDVEFDEKPKEVCNQLPEPGKYQPRFFTTTALQQAKVNLTWDETDPNRIEIAQKLASGKVDDIADGDLLAYLASSSDEEANEKDDLNNTDESDNENEKLNSINKYKALLQDIENKEKKKDEKDVEMEITWGIDIKEKTDKMIKKKLDEKDQKTPFQQYLDKRKEKKKLKREENKKKHLEEDDSDVPSGINMNDPYFAEEFDKPEFKKATKNKKSLDKDTNNSDEETKNAELELLLADGEEDDRHFSLKKIQERESESKSKKKLKKKGKMESIDDEDNFKVNVADERFSALYSSHHFNVDPTDPHYKKTKAMEAIVNEKLKRKSDCESGSSAKRAKQTSTKDPELSVLIKSVKRKTEILGNKKRK